MLCARITYLGELGYELYVPAESGLKVYDALQGAGTAYDLRPVGLKALASLRMEKGYRDFGHDIDNTDCPLEVGLGFALALDKPGGFVGREAVLARKAANASFGGMRQRLVQVRVLDPSPLLFHAEVVHRDGVPVGYVRAASYGWTLGSAVGLAFVSGRRLAGDGGLARGGVVGGRRGRGAAPDRGVAAADVRPDVRADPRLTWPSSASRPPGPSSPRWCRVPPTAGCCSASPGRPGRASPRWPRTSPRRTAGSWCRWTASTSPTSSWPAAGCWTARARRRPSTAGGTPRCWPGCAPRPDHVVMAPAFERDLEQPLAGAIPVPPTAGLVVTEGNYLLLDTPEWRAVRACLDAVWHVETPASVRVPRLVARHEAFGKSPAAARAWVDRVDEPNAALIDAARHRADLVLDLAGWAGTFTG